MSLILDGSNGITFPNSSTQAVGFYGFKNRIINGGMVIDQRNAGASVTISSTAAVTYTLDRWGAYGTVGSKFSVQQNAGSITPPAGFTNYLGTTSLASTSLGSSDYYAIQQPIEGFNFADFGWGTANAKTVTLSAWVYSSLTGTFGGVLNNSAVNRSYPFSYSIPVANTWTQINITIAGDTTGTWIGATNGVGAYLRFSLGSGSTVSGTAGSWAGAAYTSATGATSVVGTNGATFYITGVQLEAGSTATSFDYRPYGTELNLCQRYFVSLTGANVFSVGVGLSTGTSVGTVNVNMPVSMRSLPTAAYSGTLYLSDANTYDSAVSSIASQITGYSSSRIVFNTSGGMTQYRPALLTIGTSGSLTFSSEL